MPVARNSGEYGCPKYNQAQKIIRRFGGETNLARLLGLSRITVYRWQYKRPVGRDGLIPPIQINKIREAARINGILIRPEDWVPEVNRWDENGKPLKKAPKQYIPDMTEMLS